jgi:hypothetical protein
MIMPCASIYTRFKNPTPSTQNGKNFQEIKVDGIANEETILIVWFIRRIGIL